MQGWRLITVGDDQGQPREFTAKEAYISGLCSLPLMLTFSYFGKWETGFGAGICGAIVILVARIRWDLRQHVWFWIAILAGALLQVPIILVVPWEDRGLTGIAFLPLGLLDYAVVYGLVKLTEKITRKK